MGRAQDEGVSAVHVGEKEPATNAQVLGTKRGVMCQRQFTLTHRLLSMAPHEGFTRKNRNRQEVRNSPLCWAGGQQEIGCDHEMDTNPAPSQVLPSY